jgi:hypothetical protein
MTSVKLTFCFYGTQLIAANQVKTPVYATKIVSMPCVPPVGTMLSLIESKAVSSIAGWGNGPVAFVSWEESDPDVMVVHFRSEDDGEPMDYLETQWFINQLKQVGWSCDQEGD